MKAEFLITAFLSFILLSACGSSVPASPTPDFYAIHTAAAQTVVAELTQNSMANTATPEATFAVAESLSTATTVPTSEIAFETITPEPTETLVPSPTLTLKALPTDPACDNALWLADVSVQDGTEMSPGQSFEKTWRIKNAGTCTWEEGYHLIFSYGEKMDGQAYPLTAIISPEGTAEVTVLFKAPLETGEYSSTWRMANATANNFGEEIFVKIVVR